MQALWGHHIIGTLLIITGFNEAFPAQSTNLEKFNQNLITIETPNERPGKVDSLLISSEKIKDTLNANLNEVTSTVYIVDDVPNVEFKIVKEQNSENNEKINHSLNGANNPDQVQNVYQISKSPNRLQNRRQRSIPDSQVHSSGHTASGGHHAHGSHHGGGQSHDQMGGDMNGNMQLGGGMGMPMSGMGMGGIGMGGLGMGGMGMGGMGMPMGGMGMPMGGMGIGMGMGGLGMGGLGMGGMRMPMGGMGMPMGGMGMGGLGMGSLGMGGMGMPMSGMGMPMGGMGTPMGGMGMGGLGMAGLGMGGMGMPMGGMGMHIGGMGGIGMPMGGMGIPLGGGISPLAGMPPAAYIPAPGGGIIPAIPPSTFIPPPPMPFPGAWGPHGFPGHAVGFPIITPSFAGGPLIGG